MKIQKILDEINTDLGIITDDGVLVSEHISPNISLTPENYLWCENVTLARIGRQEYTSSELSLPSSTGRVTLIRNEEEVFKPESLASFENKPVTILHPVEMLNSLNWKYYAKGSCHNVRREGDYIVANLLITDETAIKEIQQNGLNKISCGYTSNLVEISDGLAEQTDIVGNHIALVLNPRAGDVCQIIDTNPIELKGQSPKETPMTMKQKLLKLIGVMDAAEEIAEDIIDDDADKAELEVKDTDLAHEQEESRLEESIEATLKALIARMDKLEAMNVKEVEVADDDEADKEAEVKDDDAEDKDKEAEVVDCNDDDKEAEVKDDDDDEEASGEYAVADSWNTFISKAEIIAPGMKFSTPIADSKGIIGSSKMLDISRRKVLDAVDISAITKQDISTLSVKEITILFDSAVALAGIKNNIHSFISITDRAAIDPLDSFRSAHASANKR